MKLSVSYCQCLICCSNLRVSVALSYIIQVPLEWVIEADNYFAVCLCSCWDGEGVAGRCGSCQSLSDLGALGGSVHTERITRHFTGQMSCHYSQHWNYWLPVREPQWKSSWLALNRQLTDSTLSLYIITTINLNQNWQEIQKEQSKLSAEIKLYKKYTSVFVSYVRKVFSQNCSICTIKCKYLD